MKKTILKTVFSTLLTWVIVTGTVFAFTNTVPYKQDNQIVSAAEWNTIKTTIDSLKNSMNLSNYFTKQEAKNTFIDAGDLTACKAWEVAKMTATWFICVTQEWWSNADMDNYFSKQESDKRYLKEVQMPTIVMEYGWFQWKANVNHRVNKPTCSAWYNPKIQVNLDWFKTIWDVNWDDIIWTWSVDKWSYWYVNGWDYDCGIVLSSWEIIEWCGTNDNNYNQSKISYTTYCTSVQKELPKCSTTKGQCTKWTASSVYMGTWTCKHSGETENCGQFDPSDICRTNPSAPMCR